MIKTTEGYRKYVGKFGPILLDEEFRNLPVSLWGWLEEGTPEEWKLLTDEKVGAYLMRCAITGIPMSPESFTRYFWMDDTGHFRFPVEGGQDVVAQGFEGFVKYVSAMPTVAY